MSYDINEEFVRLVAKTLADSNNKNPNLEFPEKLCLTPKPKVPPPRPINGQEPTPYSECKVSTTGSVNGQEPLRYSESKVSATKPGRPESLHIFVIGPSIHGKRILIECVAKRSLGIPTEKNIHFAYHIGGFLLQGVEVGINLWHVSNIGCSLNMLQDFYKKSKTCFMLVYDINDSTTFDEARQWIPKLRRFLDYQVPIVLVGYEDSQETLASKLAPVSYSDAMNAKNIYDLKTSCKFSDLTGPEVSELIFDAAHIALESKVMTPDSESFEPEENLIPVVNCGPIPGLNGIHYSI